MDQIAQQLKTEIESLQEYIQRTEERLQVGGWVSELLDPFERVERNFTDSELREILYALYHAKHRFSVNGQLSTRIDSILSRHQDLLSDLLEEPSFTDASSDRLPARDPSIYSSDVIDEVIEEEDEEILDSSSPADTDAAIAESRSSAEEKLEDPPIDDLLQLFDEEEEEGQPAGDLADELFQTASDEEEEKGQPAEDLADELFQTASDEEEGGVPGVADVGAVNQEKRNFVPTEREREQPVSRKLAQSDLDKLIPPPPATHLHPAPQDAEQPPKERLPPKGRTFTLRNRFPQPAIEEAQTVDIFLEKIKLDDLLLRLGISIPYQDKTKLEHLLHDKVADRVIPTLQANPHFEKQYILVPRISRFIYDDVIYPCTIKNLARTFIALFGNIKDLVHYKTHPFLDSEVPEPGWALITPETPPKSLNRSFMEQQQYLQKLATTIGLPSRLVRRRTLVEAVYDLIVGRMVLDTSLQSRTLDWTSTGASKSAFLCIFFAENGIRIRDLPRTTHNRSLGVCPNW